MNRQARGAFTVLKNKGVPVFEVEQGSYGSYGQHFSISAEDPCSDGILAADYYQEFTREYVDDDGKIHNPFGIRTWIYDLLDDKGLYAEWINPGVLGVYDVY